MTSIQSQVPYANYPFNAVGATPTTKDIASTSYDTQRPYVAKTYEYLTTEDNPSYKWPLIGLGVSTFAFLTVLGMRCRGAGGSISSALGSLTSGIKAVPSKIASLFRRSTP